MALKHLDFIASVDWPDAAGFIATCCYDLVALRVEGNFGNFILVALEEGHAGSCEDIVNSGNTISTGSS